MIDIAAGSDIWRWYSSGVVSSASDCPNRKWNINHNVVIVGYEEGHTSWNWHKEDCNWFGRSCKWSYKKTTDDVWLIQNSWGTGSLDRGFMLIKREDYGNGGCGMNHKI